MSVYAIGQISNIKDQNKWNEYKQKVRLTLEAYNAKVLFRGEKIDSLINSSNYTEVVAIEFKSLQIAKEWFQSKSYQDIVAIRQQGADVTLELYG